MKSILGTAAAVALFLGATAGNASANMVFSLSGVTLQGGGTLTGGFVTNNALTLLISADIVASANGPFSGFHYTLASSPVSASVLPQQYFQLDSPGPIDELRLYFTAPLKSTGAALLGSASYEFEITGGSRTVTSGSIVPAAAPVAAPEPGTIAMAASALPVGLVVWLWRRKRAARAA